MSGELVVLVPVLARPHRVDPLLDSLFATVPDGRVIFLTDVQDADERAAISPHVSEKVWMIDCGGGYGHKINVGVRNSDEPLIFLGADDLDFKPGWLEAAKAKLTEGIGVVGTNDLGNERVMAGHHATHSLVTRKYAERGTIDEAGKLLHEGYSHWKVDDELVATARHRGAWAFAEDSHVEHLHPYWGKAEQDDTYRKGEAGSHGDIRRFRRRTVLWT